MVRVDSFGGKSPGEFGMDGHDSSAPDAFYATEAARYAFLSAVRGVSSGDHAPDLVYLMRLADVLLEAHDRAVIRPRRLTEGEAV